MLSTNNKPNDIPSKQNLIMGLTGEFLRKIPANVEVASVLFCLLIIAGLVSIAIAPYKILLRRNFGKYAINPFEIIGGFVFFILWGIIATLRCLAMADKYMERTDEMSFWENFYGLGSIAGIFFILAIGVLMKGFSELKKAISSKNTKEDVYRGDSLLFQDIKTEEMRCKVWRAYEPAICLFVSIIALVHPLLGLPLLFASVGFLLNEWWQVTRKIEANPQYAEATTGGKQFKLNTKRLPNKKPNNWEI